MPKKKAELSSVQQQQLSFLVSVESETATDDGPESRSESRLTMSVSDVASKLTKEVSAKTTYTVSEITALVKDAITQHPVLGRSVVVEGELSNVKRSSRGHIYFTLKDASASLSGILWASVANRLTFDLDDGLAVYLTGRLEIYAPSGTYSIVASKLEPVGIGALQLAFQQIKARLEAEGLFMDEFKQDLPEFPQRIGIVTSSTGAVIHDMLRVIRRKNPVVDVLLAPVKVQGEGAAQEIAQAIQELNHPHYGLDALIVARGGGSFEDLFCFSEEPVVRAIFESRVPIVTGIGHEPDFSLADAAADYSASTPTAAADWLIPDIDRLREIHATQATALLQDMAELILQYEQILDHNATRLIETYQNTLETWTSRTEQKRERLLAQFTLYFQQQQQKLSQAAATLDALNPLKTLARGYSVATLELSREESSSLAEPTAPPRTPSKRVVSSVDQVAVGNTLSLRVMDGTLRCHILEKQPLSPIPDATDTLAENLNVLTAQNTEKIFVDESSA